MKDTIVVDLDGTLSDCSARQHLVMGKKRDYDAFHAQLEQDPPHEWCARLVQAIVNGGHGIQVVLVTARPKAAQVDTIAWLAEHLGHDFYHALFMLRADGDDTPARELKRVWIKAYGVERILFAVDDDPRNAAMFKEEGVTCLLAPGWTAL